VHHPEVLQPGPRTRTGRQPEKRKSKDDQFQDQADLWFEVHAETTLSMSAGELDLYAFKAHTQQT
jgi:hypothetical protein